MLTQSSPFAFKPHTLEYTCKKASNILDNTRSKLSKKRTLTTEETTINEIIHQESVRFIKLAYGLVIEEFVSEDEQIHPREMAGELARKKGVYKARKKGKRTKAGCTNHNADGMKGRVGAFLERMETRPSLPM